MATSKLLSSVRAEIRKHNYNYHIEHAYENWIIQYVRFHHMRHPMDLSEKEVFSYLFHLANHENVPSSEQNQALLAITFLYEQVIHQPLKNVESLAFEVAIKKR